MSKVKSPQEKKRNSLLRDRRNIYGECPTSSRKSIHKGKQRAQQALRRAVSEELRAARGSSETVDTELVQDQAEVRSIEYSRALFKKVPDAPLAVVRDRKLKRRAKAKQVCDVSKPFDINADIDAMLRSEALTLRKIRRATKD